MIAWFLTVNITPAHKNIDDAEKDADDQENAVRSQEEKHGLRGGGETGHPGIKIQLTENSLAT